MKPDVLHFTLVFMGEVESDRVSWLGERLDQVAARQAAFTTRVDGAGGHVDDGPGRRPGGVAWLTLSDGFREVADLAADVDAALGTHTYDDRRRPRPHLTVARAINSPALAALRDIALATDLEWRTSSIVLFRSHLGPGGSRYEPLNTHDLRSGPLTGPS
jgi:2'-5' RNA ligase